MVLVINTKFQKVVAMVTVNVTMTIYTPILKTTIQKVKNFFNTFITCSLSKMTKFGHKIAIFAQIWTTFN